MRLPSCCSQPLIICAVFVVLLTGLLSIGCVPEQTDEFGDDDFPDMLSFVHVGRGRQARVDTTLRLITDPVVWTAYQDSLQPILPFEEVDFSREAVLLIARPVPTGGYDLRIDFVESLKDTITVAYILFRPGADCRTADAPGVVFDVARMKITEGELRFVEERETVKCTET